MEPDIEDFDFWEHKLKLPLCSYNAAIDKNIYNVAKVIVNARESNDSIYCDDIAKKLGLNIEYVEFIQYILADLRYPHIEDEKHYEEPFTYGTSPRGLFVDNMRMAKLFLKEFEEYYLNKWEEDINA